MIRVKDTKQEREFTDVLAAFWFAYHTAEHVEISSQDLYIKGDPASDEIEDLLADSSIQARAGFTGHVYRTFFERADSIYCVFVHSERELTDAEMGIGAYGSKPEDLEGTVRFIGSFYACGDGGNDPMRNFLPHCPYSRVWMKVSVADFFSQVFHLNSGNVLKVLERNPSNWLDARTDGPYENI